MTKQICFQKKTSHVHSFQNWTCLKKDPKIVFKKTISHGNWLLHTNIDEKCLGKNRNPIRDSRSNRLTMQSFQLGKPLQTSDIGEI